MKKLNEYITEIALFTTVVFMGGMTIALCILEPVIGVINVLMGVLLTAVNNIKPVIRVKYIRDVNPIKPIEVGDWTDLRCAEDVELKAGEYKMIPLGVAMELPKGYEALVAPRSSTFKKYGVILVNSIGVIDESYCGDSDEWNFLAYALRDTKIPKNERICQFRIIEHQPQVKLVKTNFLGNSNRGGIGSTGRV